MRFFLLALLAVGIAVPAYAEGLPINTLTPEEAADGCVLLFDGKTLLDLSIEGDYEVKDGAVVVGGTQATCVRFAKNPGRQYALQFDYLVEGPSTLVQLVVEKKSMFGYSRSAMSPPQRNDVPSWSNITLKSEVREPNAEPRLAVLFDQASSGRSEMTNGDVSLTVAPGGKLSLRNIKLKTFEAESMFGIAALYAVLLAIFLVLVGVPLAVYWWRRRRRAIRRPVPGP